MINRYTGILIFVICSHFSVRGVADRRGINLENPESYFGKTLHEIKGFDHSLRKALSDTNWDAAYMYFISYFKKPSVNRIQNMRTNLGIIENRIGIINKLIAEKEEYLAKLTLPQPAKKTTKGFDPFDTRDVMTLFGLILFIPVQLVSEALDAQAIQNLRIGIEKTKEMLSTLDLYKTTLQRCLK